MILSVTFKPRRHLHLLVFHRWSRTTTSFRLRKTNYHHCHQAQTYMSSFQVTGSTKSLAPLLPNSRSWSILQASEDRACLSSHKAQPTPRPRPSDHALTSSFQVWRT